MNKKLFVLLFTVLPISLFGQNCAIRLHGQAVDETTGVPLSFANIYLEEAQKGIIADKEGFFEFDKLCPQQTHLRISHISCEPFRMYLEIKQDTVLKLKLHHHEELMNEVKVHGKRSDQSIESSGTIDSDVIQSKSNQNLADVIKEITGVSVLRTGAGIAKPIIHGLSGNRIAFLNNGVAQAGQQWGNDHAPEIDVFSADHIAVIKGVSSLAYSGNSLGGVVLIEPRHTEDDPHLHGRVNYIFQSNGLGNTLNLGLDKGGSKKAFRFTSTIKKIGDRRSANYFLTNTGAQELNASFLAELGKGTAWQKHIYVSTFNTSIGILRGAHIGNLTDLEESFTRSEPFFTEDKFSYKINSPHQKVNHQLLKLGLKYRLAHNQILNFQYAVQLDRRREYDVRRGQRSDMPALSLKQINQQFETKYEHSFSHGFFLKTGILAAFTSNTNQPETGILPLIPDYLQYDEHGYFIIQREKGKWLTELGGRLALSQMQVATISRDLARELVRYSPNFSAKSVSAGLRYQANQALKFKGNLGYTERSPAINELYSFGLHQGVSSIEVGNPEIQKENSLKATLSAEYSLKDKLFIQLLVYGQQIEDYIYLKPSLEPLLTIRGAFPLFNYEQTNARLVGLDGLISYEPIEQIRYIGKVSLLKGLDTKNNLPLVYMPSNSISNKLSFAFPDNKKLTNSHIAFAWETVFRQKNYKAGQDFLPPPSTYNLVYLELHTAQKFKKHTLHYGLSVDNLFNISYRDYLNRQRYFADELGRNITFRLNWAF